MVVGDRKEIRTRPKVSNTSSAAESRQSGNDTPGDPMYSASRMEAEKAVPVRYGTVNALIRKYADARTGNISVSRLVDGTGLTRKSLAGTLGIDVEALHRKERVNSRVMQVRMREMLEILGRITGWAGSEVQAMAWYRAQPIPAFGGRTAESLVKCDQAGALRDYLDHMAMGGFA